MTKVAIVTGAGAGIGRNAAQSLLKHGFAVSVCGRNMTPLKETLDEVGATDSNSLPIIADVGNPDDIRNLFDRTVEKFGRVDVVFCNAGRGAPPIPMDELTDKQWQSVVDTNLSGTFYCMREAFRVMKAQTPKGGRIINNGSISAHTPRPFSAPYTSTKHAITGLTKSGCLDGRDHDIMVCQIDIGNAATPMTERMEIGTLQADGSMKSEKRMDVQHVGDMIVHMANMPLDANVPFVTVMSPTMPYFGRG
jgi:NAD(P)-dependent dehydrogenase (short-subunit alcohol dehydrogenase family)